MNESLTNRQIAFILFGIIVGYGIMGLPKNIGETAGTGGWITLLIATAIMCIFTYIITYLGYIHKNKTIYEYSKMLTGKYIASLIIFIYIIEFFLFYTMIIRASSEVIKLTVLIKTPVWALCILFFLVVYYAVIKGLRIVARICELYGIIIIIGTFIIHSIMFTQGKIINLRPFFGSADIVTYVKSSLVTTVPFLGMEILTIIPLDKNKNTKKVFQYAVSMILLIGFMYIAMVESCISIMGVDSIIHYENALFAAVRRIDVRYLQFLRRLDGPVLTMWLMAVFCTATLFAYGTVFLISRCCKKMNYKTITIFVISISFILSQIPTNFNQVSKILDFTGYLSLITIAVIPSILLIITKIKKIG